MIKSQLTPSRYANRIKNGTFTVNGEEYHVPKNEHGGLNTLHGGDVGYDAVNGARDSTDTSASGTS